ncbi:MAG TPA: pyridoxine 5'-phosphate synthase [Tepidisphaeraceae bacterium]|nr:pyridoxine 5'-phosphate synthase [Tepidisphaeraceae bacterium]
MTKLSVNINKIATLRNTRPQLNIPDLLHCAKLCLDAGAAGMTIHPRPDERHIRAADVPEVARIVSLYIDAEFNIEGNPFHGAYMSHCRTTRPTQATLVPDEPAQSTSDHGWDLARDADRLRPVIAELKNFGCRVSLFMDPVPEMMEIAAAIGADRIELYTEPYAAGFAQGHQQAAEPFARAARRAAEVRLGVNAGHDLNLDNLPPFLRIVPNVLEVSIGHALIADALEFGLKATVRRYRRVCAGDIA